MAANLTWLTMKYHQISQSHVRDSIGIARQYLPPSHMRVGAMISCQVGALEEPSSAPTCSSSAPTCQHEPILLIFTLS